MIKWIIDASIRDRLMVLVITLVIGSVGYFSFRIAPLDAIPDLSDVQVIVLTEFPGQSPAGPDGMKFGTFSSSQSLVFLAE